MLESLVDDPLLDRIRAIQKGQGEDYWSFKAASKRRGAHALIHYPAMMVPTLQGKLLEAIRTVSPAATRVLDPFAGSGTILVESMNQGLDFTGIDINPLATLACVVKAGPYYVEAFEEKALELHSRVLSDRSRSFHITFDGQRKWFSPRVSTVISRIARAIEQEDSLWARRLFWLALAKVVRASCNSRMSTYKLHAKKEHSDTKTADPLKLFEDALGRFIFHLHEQRDIWSANDLLKAGKYVGEVEICWGDVCKQLEPRQRHEKFDIVMTSPPYGDNCTTIPYGQYAYLPLKWIPIDDVSREIDSHLLSNTHAIDTASLGGSLRYALRDGESLTSRYSSVRQFSSEIGEAPSHLKRFFSFFRDLESAVQKVCYATKPGGYQAWTIGSRRLQGRPVPMQRILSEMLESFDVETIGLISRNIHSKKMAMRNNVSDTMTSETVLLARKA